ncbi:MAG: hypothetical protein ACYTFY_06335 [Planctomycetota bacterium]|jgi:hypothetical protein
MKNIRKRAGDFFKALHKDESAPGTVEWVLMIIVALVIMAVIYFIAQWVMEGGTEEANTVEDQRKAVHSDQDAIKKALKVKD